MRILFDTNIVLDVLLDREPFSEHSSYLMAKVEKAELTGFLCATTITTIYYLVAKFLNEEKADRSINSLMALFEIAPVNRIVIENALVADFPDFEDAVLHESARHAGAEYIITRNISDFESATIPVYTPTEFLKILESI